MLYKKNTKNYGFIGHKSNKRLLSTRIDKMLILNNPIKDKNKVLVNLFYT